MIDANDAPLDTPIWCVYGPNCFPTVFCCIIRDHDTGKAIWGYSVYKRKPGFRTLGQTVGGNGMPCSDWIKNNGAKLFLTQDEAFEHLKRLTTPKPSALV